MSDPTAIERLRRRLGAPEGTSPRAFFELATIRAMLELQGAVTRWLDSDDDGRQAAHAAMRHAHQKLEDLP